MISAGWELISACKLYRQPLLVEFVKIDKGKPVERQGRKAMGLHPAHSTGQDCQAAEEIHRLGFSLLRPGH